ncbi:HAD-like domain-containing protein [Gilbertella persicaria]|uniref:HAD-like domain-containing protein n=1 Tax=Gilbertella persicaria TaxID=101096 RepID=UPI002220AC45|nr:HAD-like domain-containing protein [Gilbertella persicaria]KAI8080218.1 HAD-like domain-containing protein [Gilbertella persicaria]
MKNSMAPTKLYLDIVNKRSTQLEKCSKNQLLILDLNGTLVSRVSKRSMYVRPYSQKFIDYVFDNFNVMLWSSARPHSVRNMCRMFGKRTKDISVIWDRTSFELSEVDYGRKVVTVKDLDKVWKHFNYKYDPTNTILIDDSPVKAQLQPYNCIHPSEFKHTSKSFVSSGESELLHLINYLKVLQFQSNVANYIKQHPYDHAVNDNAENIYLVEHYVFADPIDTPPRLTDLKPVEDELTSKLAKLSF